MVSVRLFVLRFMKLLVGLMVCAQVAHAQPVCRLVGRPWLEGRVHGVPTGQVPLSRAVDARLGEEIDVFLAAPGRLGKRAVVFGESGPHRVSWTRSGCPAVQIA